MACETAQCLRIRILKINMIQDDLRPQASFHELQLKRDIALNRRFACMKRAARLSHFVGPHQRNPFFSFFSLLKRSREQAESTSSPGWNLYISPIRVYRQNVTGARDEVSMGKQHPCGPHGISHEQLRSDYVGTPSCRGVPGLARGGEDFHSSRVSTCRGTACSPLFSPLARSTDVEFQAGAERKKRKRRV